MSEQRDESTFGPGIFTKRGEAEHDLIVTMTIQSKVTGQSVTVEFPKARFLEGKIANVTEQESITEWPGERVWLLPVSKRVEFELSLMAFSDEEEQCIYRLTQT